MTAGPGRRVELRLDPGQRRLVGLCLVVAGWVYGHVVLDRFGIHPPVPLLAAVPPLLAGLLAAHWWPWVGRVAVVAAACVTVAMPAWTVAAQDDHHRSAIEAMVVSQSAVEHLRDGRNPYAGDHTDAINRSAYPLDPGDRFEKLQYPPLAWLPFPILELPSELTTGNPDARPAYALMAIGLALALAGCARDLEGLAWATFASSSGFVMLIAVEGTHDLVLICLLVGALALWHRPRWAALLAGLAAAVKTLAWPMLPVVAVALAWRRSRREQLWVLAGLGGPLAATSLPFLLWDPAALLRGLVLTDDTERPGVLSLRQPLIDLLGVDPAWPLRLAVLVVAIGLAVHLAYQHRLTRARAALLIAFVTIGVQVFSMVFYPYHLALPIALVVTAALVPDPRSRPAQRPAPRPGSQAPRR